jgi:phage baseplate assembly protein W
MGLNITFEKSAKSAYTYSDLHLDLTKQNVPLGNSNLMRTSGNSDIKTDFDEYSIANSLRNLFSTRPLQRLLNPEYGLDLTQFLFEKVDVYSARLIARKLTKGIEKYESRAVVNIVDVQVDAENNRYNINIALTLPTLNRDVTYTGIFTENGFTI